MQITQLTILVCELDGTFHTPRNTQSVVCFIQCTVPGSAIDLPKQGNTF